MMTEEQVIELMKDRGFFGLRTYQNLDGSDKTFVFGFDTKENPLFGNKFPIPDFVAEVNLDNENFCFKWKIPKSINDLSTPWCNPVTSRKQFDRILIPFISHASLLNFYIGEENGYY